jgi:hypothetical protein
MEILGILLTGTTLFAAHTFILQDVDVESLGKQVEQTVPSMDRIYITPGTWCCDLYHFALAEAADVKRIIHVRLFRLNLGGTTLPESSKKIKFPSSCMGASTVECSW